MIAMIAEPDLPAFRRLVAAQGGTVTFETPLDERPGSVPLYEYTWNHTTLQVLKADRGYTYLQSLHPPDRILETVAEIDALFPGELHTHLEFLEFAGRMTCAGLAVIRYTTPERLDEIMQAHEARGVAIANPHVYTLEDGTRYKRAEANQLGFKQQTDPMGLLNPGKMRTFVPRGVPA
jgi:FAD/FMN-containing dehydrogenase